MNIALITGLLEMRGILTVPATVLPIALQYLLHPHSEIPAAA